jgi:hypothetical protein
MCTTSIIRAIIVLMMEAVRTSETSVNVNVTTWLYIPENSKLHTCRHENLKSHNQVLVVHVNGRPMVYSSGDVWVQRAVEE